MKSVAIVGAGPAGMMAAIAAAERGSSVTIFEHTSKVGSKLLLTGGGRCNFTTSLKQREIVAALGRKGKFLGNALAAMSPEAVIRFFDDLGVRSRTEPDGRVVPASGRAVDIRRALTEKMALVGVRTVTGIDVSRIVAVEDGIDIQTDRDAVKYDAVVIATGGRSYPDTGSDGSGYALVRAFGHSIAALHPAEVPLKSDWQGLAELQGITLDDAAVVLPGSRKDTRRGGVLFTHFGISGPAVLDISGDVSEMLAAGGKPVLSLNLCPDLDPTEIRALWEDRFAPDRSAFFGALLPKRMARFLTAFSEDGRPTDPVRVVTSLAVPVTGTRGWEHAMVTRGGVDLSEVDRATMQSRLVRGLFFAGEVLDLDGPMGGFNLQIAWSTGWLAGISAAGP